MMALSSKGHFFLYQLSSYQSSIKELILDSALVAENVCTGPLCDGQTYHKGCPCLEAPIEKTWILMLALTCPQLTSRVNNEGEIFFYSNAMTNTFVTNGARSFKSNSPRLGRFKLDESVEKMVTSINSNQGFLIVGWFKPAHDEEGVAIEHKKFHLCAVTPAGELSDTQLALQFSGEETSNTDNTPTDETSTISNLPPQHLGAPIPPHYLEQEQQQHSLQDIDQNLKHKCYKI